MNRLILIAALSGLALAPARAAEECKSSIVQPFPGAVLRDCTEAVYDEARIPTGYDKARGEQVFTSVEGRKQFLTFNCPEGVTALQLSRNFENALRKAGAKILVSAGEQSKDVAAVFESKKTWVYLKPSDGYYEQTILTEQPMQQVMKFNPQALKEDNSHRGGECRDLAAFPPVAGGDQRGCEDSAFDEVKIPTSVDKDGEPVLTRLEGRIHKREYNAPKGYSQVQIRRNLENALKASGAKVLVSTPEALTALFESQSTYLYAQPGGDSYRLTVVTVEGMKQEAEVTAGALLGELQKTGRVAVYGINFATNKAAITEDSGKVLAQVQQLLQDNADLKVRIEGHTDNAGKPGDNLALSKKRAAAVKEWLVKHGIAEGRLTTEGYGQTKPVEDNKTSEGKAKNRRVELVKI